MHMFAINCPIPDREFVTDDVDAVLAGAQLNIHALIHQQSAGVSEAKKKPPKIYHPSISRTSAEELCNNFFKLWDIFKKGTNVSTGQILNQLW